MLSEKLKPTLPLITAKAGIYLAEIARNISQDCTKYQPTLNEILVNVEQNICQG